MKLITKPGDALKAMKKEKNLNKSIGILAIAGILFGISVLISGTSLANLVPQVQTWMTGTYWAALITFLFVFVGGLFLGWLVKIVMTTLGCKGTYFEGLTSIAYPAFMLSVAGIISALVNYIPYIGSILAFLVTVILACVAFALTYRTIKELFGTDVVTAFIGLLIVWSAVAAAGAATIPGIMLAVGKIPFIAKIPGLI